MPVNQKPDGFIWPLRVYHEDTDGGGIVYYANYLKFMERARTEQLRHLGFEQDELKESHQSLFVVKRVEIDYVKPAIFNDQLEVTCRVQSTRRASFQVEQIVSRQNRSLPAGQLPEVLASGIVTLACLHADTLAARRIPEKILCALQSCNTG